ncbi:hypothetical protein SBA4_2340004 [Candidatus Sulfopaludibacter sp. SbA4]|nr:hypothetical protein SBA4_2340004 [Candidatus Sulfopaludibacter sp. SbA4]
MTRRIALKGAAAFHLNTGAGKLETSTTDAMGNLVAVTEPNPAGGSNLRNSIEFSLRAYGGACLLHYPFGRLLWLLGS